MSERLTPQQVELARQEIYRLAKTGGKSWLMSIPVRDEDSDCRLISVCDSHELLRADLAAKEAQLADLRTALDRQAAAAEVFRQSWSAATARAERAEQGQDLALVRSLAKTVLSLRGALEMCADPEDGWPDTAIADAYEASRKVVPELEGELDDDTIDRALRLTPCEDPS